MIVAVSHREDLHALAVQHAVRSRGSHDFHIVESDNISGREGVSWSSHSERSYGAPAAAFLTSESVKISVEEAELLWWRRPKMDQEITAHTGSTHERGLVNNDCRGALGGILAATFRGEWLSSPQATDQAADKLYQLCVAREAGLRVPRTLVSQSRDDVIAFSRSVKRTIVKPVVGARGPALYTRWLDAPETIPASSFEVCPATYQEYIEGRRHIRLNCFGEQMYAALIETDDLDWRPNLNVPISRWPVPPELRRMVSEVLRRMGLRMGVVDLKLTPEGEPVWLEVNPQGQFLFLEPLTGEPLTEHFADFLISEASAPATR